MLNEPRGALEGFRRQLPPELLSWLAELEADALHLVGDRIEIARRNAWSYSPTSETRRRLTPEQVATFLDAVAQLWSRRLAGAASGAWLFYAWHDEQAGSLRFSAVPGTLGDPLPFGAKLETVHDPLGICEDFLSGSDVISWAELDVRAPEERELEQGEVPRDPADFVLKVYVREVKP